MGPFGVGGDVIKRCCSGVQRPLHSTHDQRHSVGGLSFFDSRKKSKARYKPARIVVLTMPHEPFSRDNSKAAWHDAGDPLRTFYGWTGQWEAYLLQGSVDVMFYR